MPFLGKQPLTGEFKKLDFINPDGGATYSLTYGGAPYLPGQATRLMVSVNGVIQEAGDAYTTDGSTITFSENLTFGTDEIDFIVGLGEIGNVTVPAAGSVTPSKLDESLVINNTNIRVNDSVYTQDITIPAGKNAFVAGPVQFDGDLVIDGTLTIV